MDNSGDTIFGKIIRREIPAHIVYESEQVLAFKDINPQAPVHVLIIPKKKLTDVRAATAADTNLLGQLLLAAPEVAKAVGIGDSDFRLVVNNGAGAGQSVFHLHVHLLAGRPFAWPPG